MPRCPQFGGPLLIQSFSRHSRWGWVMLVSFNQSKCTLHNISIWPPLVWWEHPSHGVEGKAGGAMTDPSLWKVISVVCPTSVSQRFGFVLCVFSGAHTAFFTDRLKPTSHTLPGHENMQQNLAIIGLVLLLAFLYSSK